MMKNLKITLAALVALALSACGGAQQAKSADSTGDVMVSVRSQASTVAGEGIKEIRVTASLNGEVFTRYLPVNGTTNTGSVTFTGLKAGHDALTAAFWTFKAEAMDRLHDDAAAKSLYSGSQTQGVVRNQATRVVIIVNMGNGQGFFDNAPLIDGLMVVLQGDSTPLCPMPGDSVTLDAKMGSVEDAASVYQWTSPCAADVILAGKNPTFTEKCSGEITFTFKATDSKGVSSVESILAPTFNAFCQGSANVDVTLNSQPNIVSLTSPDAQVNASGIVKITTVASDDDGDALSFEWGFVPGASPCGTFTNSVTSGGTNNVVFHAAAVSPASFFCGLQVFVKDVHGASVSGILNVNLNN